MSFNIPPKMEGIAGVIPQSLQLQAQRVIEPTLMSHFKRVLIDRCVSEIGHSEPWKCQYWSAYIAATVMWLWKEDGIVCGTRMQNDGDLMKVILL